MRGLWRVGLMAILYFGAMALPPTVRGAEPADPALIPEARRVLDYLESLQGKKILTGISGCQDSQPRAVLHMTGREPAISGDDVSGFHRKWDEPYRKVLQGTVDGANRWWHEKGGIVTLHYHWMKPGNPEGSAWVSGGRGTGRLDIAKAVTPGTDEHRAVMEDLKVTADYLKQLADARVPVLWRPLHEIDGSWFWWTDAETPENTAALWRLMFDYFVNERELHNLIWVYNAAHVTHGWKRSDDTLEEEVAHRKRFYPGAEYVDIASIDTYANPKLGWGASWEDARRPAYEMMQQVAPGKMLAIAEDSALLNPDIAQKDGPPWLYCLAWWSGGKSNPVEWMRKTFSHEHMLTLDELPLLVEGNVIPNVRITAPADGAELCGPDVSLSGFASDRNANLKRVTIHALPAPWRNWFIRSDDAVIEAFPDSTTVGEASLTPDGRWTFTWQNAPAGIYNVVALARDSDSLVACSNVVRVTEKWQGKVKFDQPTDIGDIAACSYLIREYLKLNPNGRAYIYTAWPGIPAVKDLRARIQAEAIQSAMRPSEKRQEVMKRIETRKPNHEEMEALRKSFDYAAHWLKDYDPAHPDGNTHCRAHMFAVMEGLKKNFPDLWEQGRLGMVPVGDVFLELDEKIRAGQVPGIGNVGEFSADGGHLRSGLPRYTLAATYYAVLFREHPGAVDWKIFQERSNYDSGKYGFYVHQPDLAVHLDITPERAKVVNDTIWEVVSEHPYTAVEQGSGK